MNAVYRARRPGPLARLGGKLRTIRQLNRHLIGSGRWWLVPMVVILVLTAALVVVVHLVEVAAPFVYSLF